MALPGSDTHMRIGLLGGSFNPAHPGHRHLSLIAMKQLELDRVWWMVSPQNPLKGSNDTAPMDDRMVVAQLAADHPRIEVTNIEKALGTRYTADTLRALKAIYPRARFVWLMGADNLEQIPKWDRWEQIFETVPIAVINRPPGMETTPQPNFKATLGKAAQRFAYAQIPQEEAKTLPDLEAPAWTYLRAPLDPTSSTAIRQGH